MPTKIEVVRQGTENTADSHTDGGVLTVLSALSDVLSLVPPEDVLPEMIGNTLEALFASVTESRQGMGYRWSLNPDPPPTWLWECDDTTTFAVLPEGDTDPILVTLSVVAS